MKKYFIIELNMIMLYNMRYKMKKDFIVMEEEKNEIRELSK